MPVYYSEIYFTYFNGFFCKKHECIMGIFCLPLPFVVLTRLNYLGHDLILNIHLLDPFNDVPVIDKISNKNICFFLFLITIYLHVICIFKKNKIK